MLEEVSPASARALSAAGADDRERGTEANSPPRALTFTVLFVSVVAMSWAAPLIRFTDAPPLVISFWRLVLAMPLIGGILAVRGEWSAFRSLSRVEWATAAVAGIFLAAHFAAWIASVSLTSVAASVALVSTQPVWVALFAMLALRELPSRNQWIGIAMAVAGALVISVGGQEIGPNPLLGDLLALTGAILVAGYYVIGRRLRQVVSVWPYVAIVYGFAALTLLVALLFVGQPLVTPYGREDWLVFLALAVGPMVIGHTGQNWALRYVPAYAVNLTLLGEPVGATLIAWLLPAIAETPPLSTLGGGMLILSGIFLGLRRR